MRNPELEREILAANHDPAAYLVYADWLQSHGDLRGELIVRELRDRDANSFRAEHLDALLGSFATAAPSRFSLGWRCGFIQHARIGWDYFDKPDLPSSGVQLEQFLRLESAALIESLHLGPTEDESELSFGKLADAISAVGVPSLRTLYLGDIANWDYTGTSTQMPDCAAIPNLRELHLVGGAIELPEHIDLPELRSFTAQTGSLGELPLRRIAAAHWPELEQLDIWFGDPDYGGEEHPIGIEPILAAQGLANVKQLGLKNAPFADELVGMLIGSPILRQLTHLDLSMGNLSDRGVALMLDALPQFAHLQALVLDNNALTDASWPAARALAKTVNFGVHHEPERALPRTPDSPRWVSVGE